jgi:hypothetical protein
MHEPSVYVAGRTSDVERVRRVQQMFRDQGWKIAFDWTGAEGEIRKGWGNLPGEENDLSTTDAGRMIAHKECVACTSADLIVLLWKDGDGPRTGMLGALIEVGMGIASDVDIWVVGATRDSVFFCLPSVTMLSDEYTLRALIEETDLAAAW